MARWRWAVGAAVIVAGLGYALYPDGSPWAGEPVAAVTLDRGAPVPSAPWLRQEVRPPRGEKPRVDIDAVEEALARLDESGARITQEQLDDEQRRMREAKARFEAIQVAEPETREITDESGLRWIELKHASGEIRYELAPEPEPPAAETP
jgi:hypothetical protein